MNIDPRDPFGEHIEFCVETSVHIVGVELAVRSTDQVLVDLVVEAFGNLPVFATEGTVRKLCLQLTINDCKKSWKDKPPPPFLSSADGLLCGVIDSGNFTIIDPENRRALISVSQAMLRHPHLVRYELIELAVLTLVGRALSLVPLHGAYIGFGDAGCLLIGSSGAGKSTLCLLALVDGMEILSEDSVFVSPRDLSVYGIPNFLHLRPDALGFLEPGPIRDRISNSPVIQRRSGIEKFAMDFREGHQSSTPISTRLAATVFLSAEMAESQPALLPLESTDQLLARLVSEQPYAAALPEWSEFSQRIVAAPCYELRRSESPRAAIDQLHSLVG